MRRVEVGCSHVWRPNADYAFRILLHFSSLVHRHQSLNLNSRSSISRVSDSYTTRSHHIRYQNSNGWPGEGAWVHESMYEAYTSCHWLQPLTVSEPSGDVRPMCVVKMRSVDAESTYFALAVTHLPGTDSVLAKNFPLLLGYLCHPTIVPVVISIYIRARAWI